MCRFALWTWVPAIGVAAGLTGFLLLACLPVLLEVAERRAGPAGTSATALIWLAGNAGGIAIALIVQTVVHHPLIAFLVMAVIAAGAGAAAPAGASALPVTPENPNRASHEIGRAVDYSTADATRGEPG